MHGFGAALSVEGWRPDAGVALTLGAGTAAYAVGVTRLWRLAGTGRGVRRWQAATFAGAIAVVATALASPLDAWADDLFSAHMAQHVLLVSAAPPLFLLGAPLVGLLWACPTSARRRLLAAWHRAAPARGIWRWLTAPAVAWLLHAGVLWAWHMPRLYELALRHDGAHAAEHAGFFGTGVLLWWSILYPRGPRRQGYAVGILTLFLTALQGGALGALITLSPRPWYALGSSGAPAVGLTVLEDQQLAGLLMWVVGGGMYAIAMGTVFIAWMRASARTTLDPFRIDASRTVRDFPSIPPRPGDVSPVASPPR